MVAVRRGHPHIARFVRFGNFRDTRARPTRTATIARPASPASGFERGHVGIEIRKVGPTELEWDEARRYATLRFVEPGTGGRDEAETLTTALAAWVGGPAPAPYRLLVDCSEMVDVDASWRAIWSEHFRAHRDVAVLAWFNANPRIQLIVLMFLKGTGAKGRPFASEAEARAYLDAEDPAA